MLVFFSVAYLNNSGNLLYRFFIFCESATNNDGCEIDRYEIGKSSSSESELDIRKFQSSVSVSTRILCAA